MRIFRLLCYSNIISVLLLFLMHIILNVVKRKNGTCFHLKMISISQVRYANDTLKASNKNSKSLLFSIINFHEYI